MGLNYGYIQGCPSLDAQLSMRRVKHPQRSLNRYLQPSSCGTALLLVSCRTNSSPNTAQLKDEGVCNYTIRLSTSETNYSNLKAANSNKFVCLPTTHFRTGVRLCQCGHVYDIETTLVLQSWEEEGTITKSFVKAKCRPTMRKHPAVYQNFICLVLETPGGNCISIESANCMYPAGKSGGCVHVAALLLNLAEVTQTACITMHFWEHHQITC